MTVNLFADFDAMDDPYRIAGISGECLRAYHLAQDKSIPVEEREQWIKALIERTHNGDVNAEFCLGLLTRDDFSDELNAQKSELWFSSAAAQGHSYAAYHYALCLEKRGELEQAIPWYEKAADAGILRAQRRLVELGIREDAESDVSPRRTIQFCLNRSRYKAYVVYDELGKSHYYVPGLLGEKYRFKRDNQGRCVYICTEMLVKLIQKEQKGRIA